MEALSEQQQWYRNVYLLSDGWKSRSKKRLARDGFKCTICKTTNGLSVHHLSYARIGNEDIENDLITLCKDCHKELHSIIKSSRIMPKQQKAALEIIPDPDDIIDNTFSNACAYLRESLIAINDLEHWDKNRKKIKDDYFTNKIDYENAGYKILKHYVIADLYNTCFTKGHDAFSIIDEKKHYRNIRRILGNEDMSDTFSVVLPNLINDIITDLAANACKTYRAETQYFPLSQNDLEKAFKHCFGDKFNQDYSGLYFDILKEAELFD